MKRKTFLSKQNQSRSNWTISWVRRRKNWKGSQELLRTCKVNQKLTFTRGHPRLLKPLKAGMQIRTLNQKPIIVKTINTTIGNHPKP